MRDKPNEWVSIADLMAGVVGVVILFFVAIAVLQRNAETAAPSEGELARQARAEIIAALKESLDQTGNGTPVDVSEEYDVVRFPSEGMFESSEDRLNKAGRETTGRLLTELSAILPCYSVNPANIAVMCTETKPRRSGCEYPERCSPPRPIFEAVLIEGHADAEQLAGRCDNWCLSTARAKAVFEVARWSYGDLMKLRNSGGRPMFGLAGYGASRPLPDYPANDSHQRRVEIRFVLSPLREKAASTDPASR